MCEACWNNSGRPELRTPEIEAVAKLIEAADPYGALHIVVDDWNLEDDHIQFCRAEDRATDDERALCDRLLAMTLKERASAMALADGFV